MLHSFDVRWIVTGVFDRDEGCEVYRLSSSCRIYFFLI